MMMSDNSVVFCMRGITTNYSTACTERSYTDSVFLHGTQLKVQEDRKISVNCHTGVLQ